jgi:hypothetical protein
MTGKKRALFMIESGRIIADLAKEEDKNRILKLNRLEYGSSDVLATGLDFSWRYEQNPAGQALIPVIRDGQGNVIGFIWILPLRIRVKGQDYLAATGTNLVIQSEYRNTFGYIKLIRRFEQALHENQIPLHFSFVSEQTYQRQKKHSPQSISTIPLLFKPLNFKSLSQTYFTGGWQRLIASRVGLFVTPLLFHKQSTNLDREITVEVVTQIDERFNDFWYQVRNKYPIMVVRDQSFLAWRFSEISGRHYHILMARRQGQMLGYIVLRCSIVRGVKTGLVMDFLVAPGKLGKMAGACLVAEAETYFQTEQMSATLSLMNSLATEYIILRKAGYAYLPEVLTPQTFRFAFFVHNTPEQGKLTSLSAQDWFVTIADYEAF